MGNTTARKLRIRNLPTKSSLQRIELPYFRTSSEHVKGISPQETMSLSILLVFEHKERSDATIYSYLIFPHLETNH